MSTWDTFCQGNRIVSEVAVFELELEIGTLLARWWNSGSRIGGNDVACVVSGLPRQMLNPETSHAWFLVYHGRCCNHPDLPVLKVLRIAYWPVKEALEALDISKWTPSASRTWIKCLRTPGLQEKCDVVSSNRFFYTSSNLFARRELQQYISYHSGGVAANWSITTSQNIWWKPRRCDNGSSPPNSDFSNS